MMRIHYLALSSILFITTPFAFSQTAPAVRDPGAIKMCAAVDQVEIPTADHPTAAEEKALAGCSSVDAYFGLGEKEDPVKARKCSFAEMDRGEKAALSGKALLSMVYANGKGVPRNYDVALKISCSINDTPGDAAGRIYELVRLKKAATPAVYSICDHSSGRELYEQCAILSSRFDKIERDEKMEKFIASWSEKDKKAFHVFWDEVEKFAKVQAGNAMSLEGTFEIQEEDFIITQQMENLEHFEKGELPKHSAEEAQSAQAAEAAAYEKTQNSSVAQWGVATHESVKKSEDEWRRYRSAWISFGKQKYPGVTEQSWNAWLDQDRADMLNKLMH